MNERQVVEDFKAMCEKSINPDLYSALVDDLIPALRASRGLMDDNGLCPTCGGCGYTQEKCAGEAKIDHPCPTCKARVEKLATDGFCGESGLPKLPADTKPKMGMYGETPAITVGPFEIREFTDPPGDSLWIEEVGEDGMQLPKTLFQPFLKKFYDENF